MGLPRDEWLHLARRLPVGQSQRFHHRRERRTNLVVSNFPDRYSCYCNACKQGGVVMKEHVLITAHAPAESSDLTLPTDMVNILDAEDAIRNGVVGFLASKNMDPTYLPDVYFSKARKRLLLQHEGHWLGRDTTNQSMQKWITYNGSNHLAPPRMFPDRVTVPAAVVVEDTFSFYKVGWALSAYPVHVYCSLGTRISDELMVKLLRYNSVVMFYDGDEAGIKGAEKEAHRLRSCGISGRAWCAPAGMDPKDMGVLAIRSHLGW